MRVESAALVCSVSGAHSSWRLAWLVVGDVVAVHAGGAAPEGGRMAAGTAAAALSGLK